MSFEPLSQVVEGVLAKIDVNQMTLKLVVPAEIVRHPCTFSVKLLVEVFDPLAMSQHLQSLCLLDLVIIKQQIIVILTLALQLVN